MFKYLGFVAIKSEIVERLWRIFFESCAQVHRGVTYPKSYAHGKQLTTVLTDGQRMFYGEIFLAYENKSIRNGYSPTEVIYGVINMQVELGLVKSKQLDKVVTEQLQRYTYPVMLMDICSTLKSLRVKFTTVKV